MSDAQTGHEKTLTGIATALAGANLMYGAGMLESGVTYDHAQLVIDNEIAGMIRHFVGGVLVNDETLAVDTIHEVGPFGDFLSCEHTLRHMRDMSRAVLFDRQVRNAWLESGGGDVYSRAVNEARRLIAEHAPEPLPQDIRERLSAIVAECDRDVAAGVG